MWSAEKIKEIRLKAMLSQQAFATALGVSISTVNRWEMGLFTPTFSAQKKLTEFCAKHKIKFDEEK